MDWSQVAETLDNYAREPSDLLDEGQRATLAELARREGTSGIDEKAARGS